MKRIIKLGGCAVAAAALAACGGGADSAPEPTQYSQHAIKNVASLGVLVSGVVSNRAGFALGFFGGTLVRYSSAASDSVPMVQEACGKSGTLSRTITKSAYRTGLARGDQINTTYANCDVGYGTVLNGTVVLTVQEPVVNMTLNDYDSHFQASMSGFSMKAAVGDASILSGSIAGTAKMVGANRFSGGFTVPNAQTFGISSGAMVLSIGSGATYARTDVTYPDAATYVLNGDVTVAANGVNLPLRIATPSTLSGTIVNGYLAPRTGTITVKDLSRNIATSTSVNGVIANVSGDTDGNGSMDLQFSATWAGLMSM